ncbi:nuclear pore complex protein DDB_G0274915-like [Polistes fuscatus]|uniref:nuclear pore complex protein DDB_G0274915-like n=1 Tax=Polistes fuscatus TaxID=30207 RepID=UPI001CA7C0C6|nr:nuclear pore complex protein DDB_G0274915-like [Polistes fuscatus]
MRSKAGGVKTVQTVAGPLLASTRYNIDPKTYTDITSPGLTLRLTKYAAEANNKLTHQSQYSAGQFPKVNLHASPIPLINTKFTKIRGPVTVRVAPPETTKYSPQERQKILSDICQSENKSPSSVVQVLKEISLKRHASREDVTTDIVKKQRTDNMLINEVDNFEETKQKRGREESPKSDDDNSSKNLRPTKRSKTPSCYDILRSLSSSIHVATGIKRKAVDCSRCGTPEFEKHFKSLKDSQHEDSHSHIELQIINKEDIDALNENKKRCTSSHSYISLNNTQKQPCVKGILKPFNNTKNYSESKVLPTNEEDIKPYEDEEEDNNSSLTATKYTDKLFMKEEPKRNDKLKSFEEEQKHLIDAGFTTNDIEEIKKIDIVKMRQTSMRARLQSMFDAISGKASGINPDVVIQAEEISEVAPAISSSTDCATLNSITTTTNVNTTPITTSALAPALTPSKILSNTKPVKHITFNLPNTENISGTKEQSTSNLVSDDKNKSIITSETPTCKTDATPTSLELTNVTTITNSSAVTTISFTIPKKTVTDTLSVTTSVIPVIVLPVASKGILKSSTSIINSSTSSTNVPSTTVILSIPSTSTSLFTNKSTIANTATTSSFSDTTNIKTSIGKSFLPNVTNTGFTMSTDFPKFNFGGIAKTTESSQINTVSVQNTTSGLSFTTEIKSMFTAPANVGSITAGSSGGGGGGVASVFQNIADNSTSSTFKNFSTTTASSVPFIFGSNTASTPKTEVSLFNTTTSNVPRTFGISGITQTIPISSNTSIIPNNPPTTSNTMLNLTSSTFSGNASSGSTTFTFSTTKPIFSFGTSNASTAENKSAFSYNTNTLENSTGLLGTTNTPVTSTTSNNTTSGFNIPGVTSSTQFSTTTVSMFNTPSTTTASIFNTPSTTTVSIFSTPATTTASMFNTPAATTASMFNIPSTTTASMFNTPSTTTASMFNTPSTTAVSIFSTPSTTAASMFNTPSTTAASMFNTPATTTASIFNTPATTTMFRTTTSEPVFGQSIAAPIFGNTTKSPFVPIQPTKSTIEFGTGNNNFKEDKPPAFGSNTTVFGSSSTPLFGSQTTAPPTFGSPSVSTSTLNFDSTNTTTAVFGAPNLSAPGNTQPSTTHNFVILTTPSPIFGNQNNSVPSFGSTTTTPVGTFNTPMQSTFETQQSTPLPFGAASNSNAFGDNKASPFGIQTTVTPAFPTNENNTSSIFTFGGNQGGQQQQSNTFSFGNNNASNNNVSTTGPVPFQFGANTSKPVTGFNFTAPSTTPSLNFGTSGSTPTFNAPTPGMFSIGSGSTAPRSRATRGRKPR